MVVLQPEFINVCFWYEPKALRSLPEGAEKRRLLHKVGSTPTPYPLDDDTVTLL